MSKTKDIRSEVRGELNMQILMLIANFKSETHPKYQLTTSDQVSVLSELMCRRIERLLD